MSTAAVTPFRSFVQTPIFSVSPSSFRVSSTYSSKHHHHTFLRRFPSGSSDVYFYIGKRLKLEGETENMGVWTKKRGSMKAVVLMATPCPKSLHGKGEKWIARNILQGLDSPQPMTAMTEKKSPGAVLPTVQSRREKGGF